MALSATSVGTGIAAMKTDNQQHKDILNIVSLSTGIVGVGLGIGSAVVAINTARIVGWGAASTADCASVMLVGTMTPFDIAFTFATYFSK